MKEVNFYAQEYYYVGSIIKENATVDVKLVLKARGDQIDPCRYNLPAGTDIAIIMPTHPNQNISRRDIVVYKSAEHHLDGLDDYQYRTPKV